MYSALVYIALVYTTSEVSKIAIHITGEIVRLSICSFLAPSPYKLSNAQFSGVIHVAHFL